MFVLLAGLLYFLPPFHERANLLVTGWRVQVKHFLNPPEKAVFLPQGGIDPTAVEAIVQATLQAYGTQHTPTASSAAAQELPPAETLFPPNTPTPEAMPTPTIVPTPIPALAVLRGAVHEYQQMNNCGPATLSMGLTFWGWQGDQRDTRAYLRPNFNEIDDKNVNPWEMVKFVEDETDLKALTRVGGEVDLLKRLVAAGFPVIIEKGFQPPKEQWMGHYELVTGYDDGRGRFITQDAYIMADFPVPYSDLSDRWWRDFNYVYVVLYLPEREAEVLSVLGPNADEATNFSLAASKAQSEAQALSGRDLFFALYNQGSSLAGLKDWAGAALAYDQAFAVYPTIPEADRPWRMLWYQTGPYMAYYFTGRYQDVINLANQTLTFLDKPVLEETLYWRGLSREAQGDLDGAIADLQRAASINPTSTRAIEELNRLGIPFP